MLCINGTSSPSQIFVAVLDMSLDCLSVRGRTLRSIQKKSMVYSFKYIYILYELLNKTLTCTVLKITRLIGNEQGQN